MSGSCVPSDNVYLNVFVIVSVCTPSCVWLYPVTIFVVKFTFDTVPFAHVTFILPPVTSNGSLYA